MNIIRKFKLFIFLLFSRLKGRKYIIITRNLYKAYKECYKYGYQPTIDNIAELTGKKRHVIEKIVANKLYLEHIFKVNEKAGCVLYEHKKK